MTLSELLTRWFDVRPGEVRKALLCFFGAYSVISFLILARALREALYLSTFDVRTLPYMTIAVAVLSLPTAGLFGRMMGSGNPHRVFSAFIIGLGVIIAALQALTTASPDAANVAFFLITVLGASLLTSGFWMVTSEQFSIRQAKRLFGLIGAGGTLGAMITGVSLSFLTNRFSTGQLVLGLVVLLAMTLFFQMSMPKLAPHHHHGESRATGLREGLAMVFERPHLRNIAALVFVATMASTILDWQFKEIVSANLTEADEMASFFGAFYGWTGVVALLIQVFVAARVMSMAGIAASLSILPILLLIGSGGMLLIPSLVVATMARGADNTLRKSLHRSVLEYLYVPVPAKVRRKTKTFIDSVVDSAAGGVGAGVLFLWVTWGGLPSRYLSLFVGGLAMAFIYFGIKTGAGYKLLVRDRLAIDGDDLDTSGFDGRNLLTVTLTRLDLQEELAKAGVTLDEDAPGPARAADAAGDLSTTLDRILASDVAVVERALDECDDWDETHVEALTRLLARTDFYPRAVGALRSIGEASVRHVIEVLLDEHADFVIRRRIPRILSEVDTPAADQALLDGLAAGRFEVRYRAAIALSRRRKAGLVTAAGDWQAIVWEAVSREVSRDRPIWELQKILDDIEAGDDEFVSQRVDVRGELSLEHTFRQLSLVLDPDAVKMAFHGIVMDDENLKSLSLEYLEQTLPPTSATGCGRLSVTSASTSGNGRSARSTRSSTTCRRRVRRFLAAPPTAPRCTMHCRRTRANRPTVARTTRSRTTSASRRRSSRYGSAGRGAPRRSLHPATACS